MQNNLVQSFKSTEGADRKSVQFLLAALSKANMQGFDYLEYKQSLGALAKLNMDEATAYKSAYATASTVGLTKPNLLKTARHYQDVLKHEQAQFNEALEKQIQQRVKSKQAEVSKLKEKVVEYQDKMQQLQERIAKAQETIDQADSHIQAAKEKIESTRSGFEQTLVRILEEIDQDIQNVETYL